MIAGSSKILTASAMALCLASPAAADIVPSQTGGFASRHTAMVTTDRAETWAMLVQPKNWWHHSFSNNSANLSLEPRAGGCFCETLPGQDGAPDGSAEHMHVLYAQPQVALRMTGALGPLQAEGVRGTLTVTLEEAEGGTRISWEYVVGGQWRMAPDQMAPVVDQVLGEFLAKLVEALEGATPTD